MLPDEDCQLSPPTRESANTFLRGSSINSSHVRAPSFPTSPLMRKRQRPRSAADGISMPWVFAAIPSEPAFFRIYCSWRLSARLLPNRVQRPGKPLFTGPLRFALAAIRFWGIIRYQRCHRALVCVVNRREHLVTQVLPRWRWYPGCSMFEG